MTIDLVWDKSECTLELDGLTIQAAPNGYPPFTYQAIVEEQDTHLLLGEQTTLTDPGKPAWYLANTLEQEQAYPPGSVIIKGKSPKRLLTIVHDIEQIPTCEPNIVKQAWQNVIQTIEHEHITSVAMPLLGTVHGKLSIQEAMQLLREHLQIKVPACLERIWLILPEGSDCACLSGLSS